jgi:hypothetical protein
MRPPTRPPNATSEPATPASDPLSGHYVPVGDSAGGLGGQSSARVALHNWTVNVIISLPYLLLLASGVLLLGVIAFPSLFPIDEADQQSSTAVRPWVGTLAWVSVFGVLSVRALTRGVVASPRGLRVQRVFRTREIAWCDIDRFQVRVDAHEDQMTWYSCVLEGPGPNPERDLPLASGESGKAGRFVERLNAALAEHRSQA